MKLEMHLSSSLFYLLMIIHWSFAPPVTPDKKEQDSDIKDDLEDYMEYHRYLKEVVQALESDPDFRDRLEKADEEDVRSGKIADQLDFVNHNVRSKLDEIKRRELERLRHLATKQYELTNELENHSKVGVGIDEHVDHANPHTFEIEDLKKLIKKTTADLEVADRQRREQFKQYEMQKEFEKHQKMETMDEKEKKKFEDELKQEEEAKKHHEPLHHPGSKQQLEEVWEKQDHMDQQFDPRAFFMMHDVDGNGVWDANEVKALFIKELDKMYGPNGVNKDARERAEEMERMREHVFQENDKNRDGLIDFHEFMMETQRADFNKDEGWKSVDENEIYTQAEYEAYERRRLEELRYLQQRGLVDAHGRPIPGAHRQIQQAQQEFHAYQQQQYHQQQLQQAAQYHGQAPLYPQGQYQGQLPPQGYQQAAGQGIPAAGQNLQSHGQVQSQPPPGQFQPQPPQAQQPPQQGQHHQGQYQGQQPPQGQFQGQLPQGQFQAQQPQDQFQGQQPQGQFQSQQPQGQFQAQQPQGQFQGQQPQGQSQGQFQGEQAQNQGQGQQPPQAQSANINQAMPPVPASKQESVPAQNQAQALPVPGQGPAHVPSGLVQNQIPSVHVGK